MKNTRLTTNRVHSGPRLHTAIRLGQDRISRTGRALFLAICVGAASAPASHAALLAYEGFDYAAGMPLKHSTGGAGWYGGWQNVANGGGTLNFGNTFAGANAPVNFDLRSSGNSIYVSQSRAGRFLDTSTNGTFSSRGFIDANGRIGANGKTLYLSFMQQPSATTGSYYEFELHRSDLGDGGRIAAIGGSQSDANVYLRAPNGTTSLLATGDTAVSFYIVKIVYNAGNDDIYVYRNPAGATEGSNVPALTMLAQADMSFNGISLGAFNGGIVMSSDEVRIGETWDDVVGGPPAFVVQPNTVAGNVGDPAQIDAMAASDLPVSYQWFKGTSPIAGANSSSLAFPSLALTNSGNYTVVASNSLGSVTSIVAVVTVLNTNSNALLAYEGFGYPAGTLNGQNGGADWNGAWQNLANSGGTVANGNLAAGANAPAGYDARSTGDAASVAQSRAGRSLDTSAAGPFKALGFVDQYGRIGAVGKILYVSFMQQSSVIDGSAYYEFEFHRGSLGDGGRIGGIGNDAHDGNVHLRSEYPAGGSSTMFDLGAAAGDVNFYVAKFVYKQGGIADVFVYRNPSWANERDNVPFLSQLSLPDMSFDGISLGAFDGGVTMTNDQIRIGESWASVVGGPPGFIVQPKGFVAQIGASNSLSASVLSDQPVSYQWFRNGAPVSGATKATLNFGSVLLSDAGSYWLVASNALGVVTSVTASVSVQNTNSYVLGYEGFDYPVAANLLGQGGGAGWDGGWVDVGGNGGVSAYSGSLLAGSGSPTGFNQRSTGNSAHNNNGNRYGRFLDVATNGTFAIHGLVDSNGRIGADGTSLYVSFLQKAGAVNSFYEFEFHRDNLGDPGRIAGVGCDAAFVGTNSVGSVFFRAPNGAANLIGTGDTNVNLYVLRIDYVPGADTVYVYRNPTGASENDNIPVLSLPGVADMSFNGVSMAAYDNGVTVDHDQIRMGLAWGDVIGSKLGFVLQPPKISTSYTYTSTTLSAAAASDVPVSYQWFFTNAVITGATNATLTLTNLQPSQAGTYFVRASNSLGSADSTVARLDLIPLAITNQPMNQVVYLNGDYNQTVVLTSGAGGFAISYQWYKNGNPLTGATNSSLALRNMQIGSGGDFYMVATSGSGSVTSSVASVTIFGLNNNLFAYEGFEYAGSLDGSTPIDGSSQNGGTGWSTPWTGAGGTAANSVITLGNLAGDLNVPFGFDSRSSSNSLQNFGSSRVGRFFDTSTNSPLFKHGLLDGDGNIGVDGRTIYLSFLLQPSVASAFYELELKRDDLGDGGRIGGIGNDTGSGDVNLRAGGVNNLSLGAGNPNVVELYVVRIDYKAGNDDVFVYRNPTSVIEPAMPTLTASNAANMALDGLTVAAFGGPGLNVDEIRLGATWEDALGLAVSNLLPPTRTANGFAIRFACTPGSSYRIQRATDLNGPWADLATVVGPASAFVEYEDATGPSGKAFYRTVTR